ncbi:MAG TPA: replication factor C large subunit, partial [Burkholderiales bacterium]|nr:replication factor C large subunit [Burkholderiales bacterium]
TTAAYALAAANGWNVIELNASDSRNYESIRRVAKTGAVHDTFSATGEFLAAAQGRRTLVLLDEADNIFGREDRGGMKAILETIRETGQPVVLIANDLYALTRGSEALKSLCLTFKFQRIRKESVIAVLASVARAEGIDVAPEALSAVAERSGGDLRSAVNDLQALAQGKTTLTVAETGAVGYRDGRATIFEALSTIFHTREADRARDAIRDLDEDPDTILLWLDENLPLAYVEAADLVEGTAALSRADIYLGRARRKRAYGLWAYALDMMTSGVATAKTGHARSSPWQFPRWLRVMSRSRGARAVRESLARKIAAATHTSTDVARQDTVPAIAAIARADETVAVAVCRALSLEEEEIELLFRADPTFGAKIVAAASSGPQGIQNDPKVAPPSQSTEAKSQVSLLDF